MIAAVDEVRRAVLAGGPVVVPFPTPLPYVVAGTDPAAVNAAKGRPAAQPLGVLVGDLAVAEPHLDLDDEGIQLARRLGEQELLNLFLPVHAAVPAWMRPSVSGGVLGLTVACLDVVRPLVDVRGFLYVSSGNRTGEAVAVTAEAADAAFGGTVPVLDGDAHRDPARPSGSATIVRIDRGQRLSVVRDGIQNAGRPNAEYLSGLTGRRT